MGSVTLRKVRPVRPVAPRRPVVRRAARGRRKRVDRLRWRRQIRSRPRLMVIYRVLVGAVGVGLMVLAVSIGWLPGPGGVPLFLVGLAVLATEFVWANHLLGRAHRTAYRAAAWGGRQPDWVKRAGAWVMVGGIVIGLWVILMVVGVPSWFPGPIAALLDHLPGVARS